MAEAMIAFFGRFIKDVYLLTACLSLLPVTEIKGSILFAVAGGANPLLAAGCAFFSSALLAIFLTFVFPPLIALIERSPRIKRALDFFIERVRKKAEKMQNSTSDGASFGVFLFVAIPLPLTGIWTGALLASLLHLERKDVLVALLAGDVVSVGVVLSVALLAGEQAKLVFNLFLIFALAAVLFSLLVGVVRKRKERKN